MEPEAKWPVFGAEEIDAVAGVLRSGCVNYWTGPNGRAFETEFAHYVGTRYGVALANGTVALELALKALGIGPGCEVVVPARSFFATAATVVGCGGEPVFADVDWNSQNLTVETVDAVVGPRTRAVIAVHLAGWPCDMEAISDYCASRGVHVIEDCAQAHGAMVGDRRAGSFGDAAAFSFCQDKIMSTGGEGGALLTNTEATWEWAWSYKDHGKSWAKANAEHHSVGFRWLHDNFGSNYRMTEMQAVLGRLQLNKLENWLRVRGENSALLSQVLGEQSSLRVPVPPSDLRHAWYKFYCFVRPEALKAGWDRDRVVAEASGQNIQCFTGSCPEIYLEQAFRGSKAVPAKRLSVCRELGDTSLMLLVDPCQTPERLERTAATLCAILQQAKR